MILKTIVSRGSWFYLILWTLFDHDVLNMAFLEDVLMMIPKTLCTIPRTLHV
jgi:hypothetical protein